MVATGPARPVICWGATRSEKRTVYGVATHRPYGWCAAKQMHGSCSQRDGNLQMNESEVSQMIRTNCRLRCAGVFGLILASGLLTGCLAMASKTELRQASIEELCAQYNLVRGGMIDDSLWKEIERRDNFSDRELSLIKEEKVAVGMTQQALRCAWGKPDDINRSAYGPEQWVYDDSQYVYVKNGVVTNWQSY